MCVIHVCTVYIEELERVLAITARLDIVQRKQQLNMVSYILMYGEKLARLKTC